MGESVTPGAGVWGKIDGGEDGHGEETLEDTAGGVGEEFVDGEAAGWFGAAVAVGTLVVEEALDGGGIGGIGGVKRGAEQQG